MRVGIFDSGIGGLTVLKSLYKQYPNNDYIYYGDTLNLPYGSKTKSKLNELATFDMEFLLEKEVDIIVIACGTVSSNCLQYLKNKYQIPIYDIINPTIEYLNESKYTNIGIIATDRTIDSQIFQNNLNKKVYPIKTPLLVPLIENNHLEEVDTILDNYLQEYIDKFDLLVLGCTHYPIIKDKINNYFNNKVELLDMSQPLLDKLKDDTSSSITIYYSKLTDTIVENTMKILELNNLNIYES